MAGQFKCSERWEIYKDVLLFTLQIKCRYMHLGLWYTHMQWILIAGGPLTPTSPSPLHFFSGPHVLHTSFWPALPTFQPLPDLLLNPPSCRSFLSCFPLHSTHLLSCHFIQSFVQCVNSESKATSGHKNDCDVCGAFRKEDWGFKWICRRGKGQRKFWMNFI